MSIYHNDKLRYYFLIYNSLVLLVQIRDQFNFNKQNKRHNIFFKAKLLHKVSSVTSGGFFQEKTTHIAQPMVVHVTDETSCTSLALKNILRLLLYLLKLN